ncbi:MAG: bifunctional alpha/beta hydrolase/class I SAM-dependent methyltransferase [Acidobacteriota bacterium]|nr:bifunctional alpha/beta hydrolase/class I SAM-dependent methyltransferase [Acidobacteriota bacterium]
MMSEIREQELAAPMSDGVELFYRAWLPDAARGGASGKAVIAFHRGHEHSGRLRDVIESLGFEDVAVFAWDARGHGRSPGARGFAPSFGRMVEDVDEFVAHVCAAHGIEPVNVIILAHSVGAVTVTTWIHDYAPRIRALVLATPALRVKLYVPFAIAGLRLMLKLRGPERAFVKSYVKSKMLTHDPEQARRYDEDELIAKGIAVNILLGMHDAATRVIEDAGAIRVPTLLVAGGADWVVKVDSQRALFDRLGSPRKIMRVFDGMYHDVLHEKDRHLVLAEIREFVEGEFRRADPPLPLLDAHRQGFTRREYDHLSRPLPLLSPKGFFFACQRLGMKTLGRLSRGVRLGYATGFDSGQTLDYVYENRPRGALVVGKLIDWFYLNSVGWKGIRIRKVNLEKQLVRAIGSAATADQPVHILDVATGVGRYILDVLRTLEGVEVSACLRDYTEENLVVGRRVAQEMGLENVVFEHGDAFDGAALAAVEPRPDVVVVSGLYELFPDNDMVLASLRGVASALDAGGRLVYTGQPWHPQVEMIARTLPNREGKPWIMRRRTQEEMDDLVRAAGFTKLGMRIDEYGIFTVSIAERRA